MLVISDGDLARLAKESWAKWISKESKKTAFLARHYRKIKGA
ncbi:hypothetical protein [Campylobacter devanensis]|nr:hypothetical protein [Campylobacter sp. P148]